MKGSDARLAAHSALCTTAFKGARLEDALDLALSGMTTLRERALARAMAYGTCRYWHRLVRIRESLLSDGLRTRDKELGVVLLMGLHQLLYLRTPSHAAVNESVQLARRIGAPWAAKLVNAVLRRAVRERAELEQSAESDPCARFCHPAWMLDELGRAWPDRWQAITHANNQQPPMTLRVNTTRTSRDEYMLRLVSAGLPAHVLSHLPQAIQLERPVDVSALPGFDEGMVSVQDGAAQLAASLLPVKANCAVLDACAAPGGKSAHLLELHSHLAELVAVDRSAERVRRMQDGFERLGLAGPPVTCLTRDARALGDCFPRGHFQAILLDAPCTATGVIRRHPDIKLRRRLEDVQRARSLQRELIRALWPLLARGGALLYATCSVIPAENHELVDSFLTECQDAKPTAIALPFGCQRGAGHQILPGDAGMDGFFYALLAKS